MESGLEIDEALRGVERAPRQRFLCPCVLSLSLPLSDHL